MQAARQVSYHGVAVDLPKGWKAAEPRCGSPADDTVEVGVWSGSCGLTLPAKPTTAIRLTAIYGRQFALSWPGRRATWHGQPAWTSRTRQHGLTTYALALPWLNAIVWAQSGQDRTAKQLLNRVHQRKGHGFDVPSRAKSIFIQSLAGRDGDGLVRHATVRTPKDVNRLLNDLRSLPAVQRNRACNGQWWPHTALLTVRTEAETRTFAARFGSCGLVVSGSGSAAQASSRLLHDVRRMVPNSGQ